MKKNLKLPANRWKILSPEVVDALANLIAATGCKQAELAGQTLDTATQTLVKSQSKTMVEGITKDCKSVKEIIEAIAKLG